LLLAERKQDEEKEAEGGAKESLREAK